MGEIREPTTVLLMMAAISRHDEALDWARDWTAANYGEIALESARFSFDETDYYAESMGANLKKTFWAFAALISPDDLATIKRTTNAAERQYAAHHGHAEPRPLNLDPGYLSESKLVLASTKDHAHRLYLRDGIYAEITLRFRDRKWQPWDWTYPDYRRADFQEFFSECRELLRNIRQDRHR
jgi:hypothetical protein